MMKHHPKGLRVRSLNRMIPNLLTLFALCAGLSSMRFALVERFDWAAAAIVLAALLDNLDGRVARLLSGDSRFGVELDSLSDFVSFGVAPVLVMYLWSWSEYSEFSWGLVTFYVVCASLRLARFNVQTEEDSLLWPRKYFMGLSSPAAAGMVLLPLMIEIQFGFGILRNPLFSGGFALLAALMMISQIPTYSLKGIKMTSRMTPFVLLAMGSFAVIVATQFWLAMIGLIIAYTMSIPLAFYGQTRLKRPSHSPLKNP